MGLEKVTTNDRFAQAVGIEITEAAGGNARAELLVEEHHLNGLDLVHGGVIMTLGDMAIAAAANSRGIDAVAINLTVNFVKSTRKGKLTANAREESLSRRLGTYHCDIQDQDQTLIAVLTGTVYRLTESG